MPAVSATAIGAAFFVPAVGYASTLTLCRALLIVAASATDSATAVGTALFASALGRATAIGVTVILCFIGANAVPLCVAAIWVHFANTLCYVKVFAADPIVRLATIARALAAVFGTLEAVLAAVEFALFITANRSDLGAKSLGSTRESGGTEAARLAASIGSTFLGCTVVGYALRLAALDAYTLLAIIASGAFAAATAAAVATTFLVVTLR